MYTHVYMCVPMHACAHVCVEARTTVAGSVRLSPLFVLRPPRGLALVKQAGLSVGDLRVSASQSWPAASVHPSE